MIWLRSPPRMMIPATKLGAWLAGTETPSRFRRRLAECWWKLLKHRPTMKAVKPEGISHCYNDNKPQQGLPRWRRCRHGKAALPYLAYQSPIHFRDQYHKGDTLMVGSLLLETTMLTSSQNQLSIPTASQRSPPPKRRSKWSNQAIVCLYTA